MLIRYHSFKDARVFEKEAVSLSKMGHQVTITAGKQQGFLFEINRQPVTEKPFQQENFIYKGVHFLAYDAKFPTGKNKPLIIKNMIQDLLSDTQEYFIDKLVEKALSTDADTYHAHEWSTLYEAVQIKRLLRKKGRKVRVIFDAHELEDDNELMKLMMKEVDHLITVSDGLKEVYKERYPEIPVTVIYNSPIFQEQIPENKYMEEPFVITYEGVLTDNKGNPQKIIEIVNHCESKMESFKFKILGKLPNHPLYKEKQKKLNENPNIECDWVDFQDLPKHLSNTHVGYIYFNVNIPNMVYAMPNKFFSYLNNGVPVVVNQVPEMKNFIEKHHCGIVIEKEEPSAADYVDQFQRLYQDRNLLRKLAQNARESMRSIYCWEKMEVRLKEMYEGLK